MKKLFILIITIWWVVSAGAQSFEADYGQVSNTRKNIIGGYDYYDESNNLAGYSEKAADGYRYYDANGNYLGKVQENESAENTYTIYNAEGVRTSTMKRLPSKKYRVESNFEGGMREMDTIPSENIASFDAFELFLEE